TASDSPTVGLPDSNAPSTRSIGPTVRRSERPTLVQGLEPLFGIGDLSGIATRCDGEEPGVGCPGVGRLAQLLLDPAEIVGDAGIMGIGVHGLMERLLRLECVPGVGQCAA